MAAQLTKLAEIQKLCPDTMLVSIGDRESDIYELFLETTRDPAGPKLLVRAEDRYRKITDTGLEQSASVGLHGFQGR